MTEHNNANTITGRFAATVRRYPERMALVDRGFSLSFGQLDHRANGAAASISTLARTSGQRACILAGRETHVAAAFMGMCKIGVASVGLHPSYPSGYLRSIVEDVEPCALLFDPAHRELAESIAVGSLPIIDLDDACADRVEPPDYDPRPQDRVWITYTSGSTGRPKGAIQTHRSVLRFIDDYISHIGLTEHDRVALLHSSRVSDLQPALIVGATGFCFDVAHRGFSGLAKWLVNDQITILPTLPGVLRHIVPELHGCRDRLEVRLLRISGEVLTRQDVLEAARVFPPSCRVVNWFGSMEVAIACHEFCFQEADRFPPVIPAGRVLPHHQVVIVDEAGESVRRGSAGEIVVASDDLFEGYWKRPDETAARLLSVPDAPGRRRFRTGDRGFFDEYGNLVITGRLDDQIKVSGFRVEASEVESALRSLAGIKEAAVCLIREPGSSSSVEALAAYVVLGPGRAPSPVMLRKRLREVVPRHMVPSYFVCVDRIPRLLSGKPDRRSLPRFKPVKRNDYNEPCPARIPSI